MKQKTHSLEIDLTVRSLRWTASGLSKRHLEIGPLGPARLDWDWILEMGQSHHVLGFIAYTVEQNGLLNALEPQARATLTHALVHAEWSNRLRLSQFKKIGTLFLTKEIPVIPLKGIDLSLRFYSATPFRQMGDVDLLIRETDLAEAGALLFESGFRLKKFPTRNRWHDRFRSLEGVPLGDIRDGRVSFERNGLDVDLHWRPLYRIGGQDIAVEAALFFERSSPHPDLGDNVRFLSWQDAVWHLLLHHTSERHKLNLAQALDLALCMSHFGEAFDILVHERCAGLGVQASKKIRTLLQDVRQTFLGGEAVSASGDLTRLIFFKEMAGIYRPEIRPIQETKPWRGWRAPFQRLVYFAGYFFPNPDYYVKERGFARYTAHWKELARNAGRSWVKKSRP